MKTLLIPTDFSNNSWDSLVYAIRLFKNEPCTFFILNIGKLKESTTNSNSFTFPTENIRPSIKEKLNLHFKQIEELPITENIILLPFRSMVTL